MTFPAAPTDPHLADLGALPRVLDAGGWFIPLAQATHVADLLPYETRQGRLNLAPLPGERFHAGTWAQVNFTTPGLRLPYPDGFFDFAYCGHTIEDLSDPEPLLRELPRVARAGVIRCPSRLSEQTRGVRDRMASASGHPHHHWIVDVAEERLRLCAKADSLSARTSLLPLSHYERRCSADPAAKETVFFWRGTLLYTLLSGGVAATVARAFARSQAVSAGERGRDGMVRTLRRLKYWRRPDPAQATANWWRQILALSRPFSRIPLPE